MPIPVPDEALGQSMKLPNDQAFVMHGASSVAKMISMESSLVSEMGNALASARMGKITEALEHARDYGFDASEFCYQARSGQWFTSLLALMARRTQNHQTRALSLLRAGPGKGWDLSVQKCWVQCATSGANSPVLLDMEQAAPSLLALFIPSLVLPEEAPAAMKSWSEDFFEAMDKWSVDWNRQSEDGLTALTELVRRVPLGLASIVIEHLEKRGADPLIRSDEGMSALDYLEERLTRSVGKDPTHASAGQAILARWKSLSLDETLPGIDSPQAPSQSRGPRF